MPLIQSVNMFCLETYQQVVERLRSTYDDKETVQDLIERYWDFQPIETKYPGIYFGLFDAFIQAEYIEFPRRGHEFTPLDLEVYKSPYGVADTVEQVYNYYEWEKDQRNLFVLCSLHQRKNQPKQNGWRWSKNGPYIGEKERQAEYLVDEPEIHTVIGFQVGEILKIHPEYTPQKRKYHTLILCYECGDIISSKSQHDFVQCQCKAVFVDGGYSYTRVGWTEGKPYELFKESIK